MITLGKIRNIPFFHTFEEEQLKAILPYFSEKELEVGEPIIAEGKINTKLIFLQSGSVSIYVKETHLVDLATVGQVFGELSLAVHGPSSATVKAKDKCSFLVFNFEDMRKLVNPTLKDGILKNFYKGTMEILAQKLIDSNKRKL